MTTIGLDIGTTTISAVAVNEENEVLEAVTVANDSFLTTGNTWERAQKPEWILDKATGVVRELLQRHPQTGCIGVTGQQHGIVYLDENGDAVSPLYTWQDRRGDLNYCDGQSYAEFLSKVSGTPVACGYGTATHFYNLHNGLVRQNAAVFCTIGDYVAMKMAGAQSPLLDASNAASLGLFDLEKGCFDLDKARAASIGTEVFPQVVKQPCFLGEKMFGVPVSVAIGDNQASYLGATGGKKGCALINVGTGSQISVYTPVLRKCDGLETRPFPLGGYLMVGASICGGRAYALLERFFSDVVNMVTGKDVSCYEAMEKWMEMHPVPREIPVVCTAFEGTRSEPDRRGSFSELNTHNMTALHWIWGVMQGVTDELYEMYCAYLSTGAEKPAAFIGSGNGLRRNRFLCKTMEQTFNGKMELSMHQEEAAFGAALLAETVMRKRI